MAATVTQSKRNLRGFIRWMRDNSVEYSDGLSFHIGDTVADIGVKALYDLHEGEMIATIPKQACLTTVTTEAESMLNEAELGGGLGLAVALMYERSLGEKSKWAGYLRLLPFQQCLPFVWEMSEIDRLLTGTELHKTLKEDRKLMKSDWKECYEILLELFGEETFPAKWFSVEHYFAAKTLVASRAFEVDDVHGFGMVPLADLFNHKTGAEDVHFTSVLSDSDSDSEQDEPTMPGSADGDVEETSDKTPKKESKKSGKLISREDESPKSKETILKRSKTAPTVNLSPKPQRRTKKKKEPNPTVGDDEIIKTPKPVAEENGVEGNSEEGISGWEGSSEVLEMIMVKDVAKGSEIYNTYGSLSNAALLHRYGFTEPDNPFDIVNVDLSLVIDVCGRLSSTRHVRRCLTLWRTAGCVPCSSQGSEYFEFSVDGRPQPELLVLLYLIHTDDATREKIEKDASQWNADAVELSDDEIERVSSAAVDKLAKALGWAPRVKKNSISRKRNRDDRATPNGSNKRTTPLRASAKPREEDPSWLTDLDKWLLTKSVCVCLLAIVIERDSIYPGVGSLTSEKLVGGPVGSTLEEDRAFFRTIDCKSDAKLNHAMFLRISERTILDKCATLMRIKSQRR